MRIFVLHFVRPDLSRPPHLFFFFSAVLRENKNRFQLLLFLFLYAIVNLNLGTRSTSANRLRFSFEFFTLRRFLKTDQGIIRGKTRQWRETILFVWNGNFRIDFVFSLLIYGQTFKRIFIKIFQFFFGRGGGGTTRRGGFLNFVNTSLSFGAVLFFFLLTFSNLNYQSFI